MTAIALAILAGFVVVLLACAVAVRREASAARRRERERDARRPTLAVRGEL